MSTEGIVIRTGTEADRNAVLALAPRLTVGVAPWRDQAKALAAGCRWLEGSLDAAIRGDGAPTSPRNTGARNTGARAFYAALGFAEEEVRLTRLV